MTNTPSEENSSSEAREKRCTKCGQIKPLDAFNKKKSQKDGRQTHCKVCRAEYRAANAETLREQKRAYRAANAEVIRERNRAWSTTHSDEKREYSRAYYAANIEAFREKNRAYQATNTKAIREQRRAYRIANAETIREQRRVWHAEHMAKQREYMQSYYATHLDAHRVRNHRRRALKKGNGGLFTTQELTQMRATQGGFCAYCHNHYACLTIDHIIPLTQGGRHEAANICLACRKCNSSKHDRTPDQWINRWYWRQPKAEYIPPYWYE